MNNLLTLKNSIATQLLRAVFGLYLLIAIVITVAQMVFEYKHIETQLEKEIINIQKSYSPSIAASLWTYNTNQIQSILIGINEIPSVVGATIDDGTNTYNIGSILNKKGVQEIYNNKNKKQSLNKNDDIYDDLINYEFSITYVNENKEITLGQGVIYSSTEIIFKQVKYGFILIIINSVIKTIALWFIFIYFIHRILSRPLSQLAVSTQQLNLDDIENIKIKIDTKGDNELKMLENAYNSMIQKLTLAKKELEKNNRDLENKVILRTQELEEEVIIRKEAQQQAESANKMKSMFLSNMSHEIRTPMTSILGMAKILKDMEFDANKKVQLDMIVRNGNRLLTILNDILDFSKLDAKSIKLELKEYDIRQCVFDIVEMLSIQSGQKGDLLEYFINDDVPEICIGDVTRISQVLINIMGNAIKFTQDGLISVNVELYTNTYQLLFSIKDTGIGIESKEGTDLFNVFTQADPSTSRKYGGTGLGLAICKHFVELMGGDIWFESNPGEGTTFYFTINYTLNAESLAQI